jgi:cytochrome c5
MASIETQINDLKLQIEGRLTEASPVEIDTVLASYYRELDELDNAGIRTRKVVARLQERVAKVLRGEKVLDTLTPAQGILLQRTLNAEERALSSLAEQVHELRAEIAPFEVEYNRRPWNRVFLATSTGGHAHNGQNCSTCHHGEYRTGFAWLIEYSGKDESEIVADAGERACTTCYPTAPVNVLKQRTKMFTPDEVEAQKARDERAIQQAKKAREADAKSITTPEGEKLYAGRDNDSWDVCKTLRTAEIAATDALMDLLLEQRTSQDPEHAWVYEQGKNTDLIQMRIARHAWCLIRSIAAKKDQTFEETFQVHEKKAQAKLRKLDRAWAKDFRNPNHVK